MIWYRNSILASIVSLAGCYGIVMGIYELTGLRDSGRSIPEILGTIACGFLIAFLGNRISVRKEERKQAAASRSAASPAGAPKSQGGASASVGSAPVDKLIMIAGVLFLLAVTAKPLSNYDILHLGYSPVTRDVWTLIADCAMVLLLAIASLRMSTTQSVSSLHIIGFWGLFAFYGGQAIRFFALKAAADAASAWDAALQYSNASFESTFHALVYFLMLLFAAFSLPKYKERRGRLVRGLWWLPAVILLNLRIFTLGEVGVFLYIKSNPFLGLVAPHYQMVLEMLWLTAALLLTGLCFRRLCAAPVVPPSGHTGPVYKEPAPSPAKPAAEPPRAAAPDAASAASKTESGKLRAAYKDLLDAGILTKEEYEQKLRELS